jgi:hypothetical protein
LGNDQIPALFLHRNCLQHTYMPTTPSYYIWHHITKNYFLNCRWFHYVLKVMSLVQITALLGCYAELIGSYLCYGQPVGN